MDAPAMPVSAIKNILIKEHKDFMQSIRERMYRFDYNNYLLDVADESTIKRIQSCITYNDLDEFIGESRRMTLEEWVNSL